MRRGAGAGEEEDGRTARARLAGEVGAAKLSAAVRPREGWRLMQEGEPIVPLT